MSENSLRIISLEAENIKRLKAIKITPKGDIEIIGGNNAQGKTSVLDSIAMILGGGKLVPDVPIRRGQKKGRIAIDLGELTAELRLTSKGKVLEVKAANGLIMPSPQAVLDKLVGKLTFDPLAFSLMKPVDQLKTLKELVGVDFDDLELERQTLYAERTEVNREAKQLEGQLEGIPEHDDAPTEPVVISDLMAQLEAAEDHNREVVERGQTVASYSREIAGIDLELERLRTRAVEIKTERQRLEVKRGSVDIPAMLDTSDLKARVATAEEINRKVADVASRKSVAKAMRAKSGESTMLTVKIEAIDGKKAERLAEAKFPVDGLSFSEEGVLLNGFPFEQGSSAEQLKVSVAMGLAMNPKLKVLLIRDGSLLDENSLKTVAEMATEAGAQVWLEKVGKGKECSVIIEDGMVEKGASETNGDE